ncbi:MAG: cation:proton antiporter [Desulfovibrionaceae bacterium]
MEFFLLKELTLLFAISISVIYICSKIRLPAIIGFLLTGIFLGPHGLGLLTTVHEIEVLAEIGIIFLLFTIGVELSLSELKKLKVPVFLGGFLQVFVTAGVVTLLTYSYFDSIGSAIFMGFLISLSSTAIVLKLFQDRGLIETSQGKLSLSLLIFQDIIIVPMVLLIPFLSGAKTDFLQDTLSIIASLLAITIFFLVARKLIPPLLHNIITKTRNREILLLSLLVICLSTAFVSSSLGLSLSLGAFLAGLLISESEYSISAIGAILPFRDVFTSLFFVSVGMLFNIQFAITHFITVILIAIVIIFIKASFGIIAIIALRYPLRPAILVGFSLAQIGEFSFLLTKAAADTSLLDGQNYQFFLGASIVTMIATPFLMNFGNTLSTEIAKYPFFSKIFVDNEPVIQHDLELQDHMIIVGYGISAQMLARAARFAKIRYTVLEMNPEIVRSFSQKGEDIHYGDAAEIAVLEHLGIRKARVISILISDPAAVHRIIDAVHREYPSVRIIARTRFTKDVIPLREMGASEVIAEEFESSVEVFSHVLSKYYIPLNDINTFVQNIRKEYYDTQHYEIYPLATSPKELDTFIGSHRLIAVRLEKEAYLCGKTLMEASLPKRYGINIVAIRRNNTILPIITGQTILLENDIIYIFGSITDLESRLYLFEKEEV